ncbi:MAG: four helix bundle protein [Chitinophagaceae bacterium]|nr:MAG: four helix bundle protein [Chitinophagaceae bacterium]
MSTFQHFYDLPVYKTCREFRKNVSSVVNGFLPKTEEYVLKNQLLRSSRSITANIAEGFGRFHHQENIQYCRQARGSLTETMEHVIVAFDEKYISADVLAEFNEQYKSCLKELNLYIKYLKSAKNKDAN